MLLTAPPRAVFLLMPLLMGLPLTRARRGLGGLVLPIVLTYNASRFVFLFANVAMSNCGPTGTSIAAFLTAAQYLPFSVVAVALWVGIEKLTRSNR